MKKGIYILGIAFFALLALVSQRDYKKPGFEFLTDMAHSIPPNVLMSPAPGSIPRGFLPYIYPATPEGAALAGKELKNPVALNSETLARGKKVYDTFCAVCHGPEGKGDGPITDKYPNPPSLFTDPIKNYPVGRIYHVVTQGSVLMPSYATQIAPEDRWKLMHYVQTLQKGGPK